VQTVGGDLYSYGLISGPKTAINMSLGPEKVVVIRNSSTVDLTLIIDLYKGKIRTLKKWLYNFPACIQTCGAMTSLNTDVSLDGRVRETVGNA